MHTKSDVLVVSKGGEPIGFLVRDLWSAHVTWRDGPYVRLAVPLRLMTMDALTDKDVHGEAITVSTVTLRWIKVGSRRPDADEVFCGCILEAVENQSGLYSFPRDQFETIAERYEQ